MKTFLEELEELINRHSMENRSNTPDFILADYLRDCLHVYETAVVQRDQWYGVRLRPGEQHDLNERTSQ